MPLLAVLAVTACNTDQPSPHIVIPPQTIPATPAPAPVADPVRLVIPAIGVNAPVIPLGLNPDKSLATPDLHHVDQVGWFKLGPKPGEVGPAVLDAHVDGYGKQGAFFHLRNLREGDEIQVKETNGTTVRFTVTSVETDLKSSFPTAKVYHDVDHPTVALITCGGSYDPAHRNYLSNVIAFADKV